MEPRCTIDCNALEQQPVKQRITQVGMRLVEPSPSIGCNAFEQQPVQTRLLQVVFQPADPMCTIVVVGRIP